MSQEYPDRRDFLKSVALAGASTPVVKPETLSTAESNNKSDSPQHSTDAISYPRVFTGAALQMISFPLGGIGAGSIGLGGRGQLRDWEIFNRADIGNSPPYAFPSIWIKRPGASPTAHVLEARIEPPYQGQDGLGSQNVPGLSRLEGATFTGEFPLARVTYHDGRLPISIALEAGTPFIPLDADASGLPIAVLRYRVRNTSTSPLSVSIAFSIENPVRSLRVGKSDNEADGRINEHRMGSGVEGLLMRNPGLEASDPGNGSFALTVLNPHASELTILKGWPAGRWWNSPMLFWDDFSSDGQLGPQAEKTSPVGAICLNRSLVPGAQSDYAFLIAWHFPNRTPERCGWKAPKGHERDIISNWYTTRFPDAWAAAEYASAHLPELQQRTERFADALRNTTLPPVIKEAASANLSTLVSTTCFRTADGEFHAFEGVDDHVGCCFGSCTHVWNYETAVENLFPSLSHSMRRNAFGYVMDERGAMSFRQLLPDGIERFGSAAADGQMGQIIKVYLDWQLSGDMDYLKELWPKAKLALEFAWIPGGWDANRDGVMEGVQHNTYDVEFYGPNPLCGTCYLGALRAAEQMAIAMGDSNSARKYRRVFESGRNWVDSNLFNGEYYVQQIEGHSPSTIAAGLRVGMGTEDTEHPQYQVGSGCLVDQLLGQYLAEVSSLGELLSPDHIRTALRSIYKYNHKARLFDHETVQRTFALNDEAALIICDYGKHERPKIPFPYYAEVMTGFEYSAAVLMLYYGMINEGLECIADIRRRYNGVRRNPWDEAECGHHYARAMASWSGVLALSGFRYLGGERTVIALPRVSVHSFHSFWSTATGWGTLSVASTQKTRFTFTVEEGSVPVRRIEIPGSVRSGSIAKLGDTTIVHGVQPKEDHVILTLDKEINVNHETPLRIQC
jgi:non-lysosomal glucosylceramidase